ncbi:MAG: hypothetical protein K2X81_26285 [Candidatus Obscuribacterales bacterium]|nr:hypothetical protein [Candidatus Obscuribacterales bacterium]
MSLDIMLMAAKHASPQLCADWEFPQLPLLYLFMATVAVLSVVGALTLFALLVKIAAENSAVVLQAVMRGIQQLLA